MGAKAGVEGAMLRMSARLQRLNGQRHLFCIRTAFISAMPMMIVGAFATAVNSLPIPGYQRAMESLFGEGWRLFGELCFNGTTQITTLAVVFSTAMNLARWYSDHRRAQVHGGICGMAALAAYVIVALPAASPGSLPFAITGVTGMFVAIFVAVASAEVFIRLCTRKRAEGLLGSDPNVAVPQAFAAVMPAIVVVGGFALLRAALVRAGVTAGFSEIVYGILSAPFTARSGGAAGGQIFNLSTHVMWLFGIHGNNVLNEVATTVFAPAMEANVAAAAAGLAPPNLVTKTFFDAFVYMGGSGTTLALLIALPLFGRGDNRRMLMRYALGTSLFNINEPLIFGIPVVLSPVYAIPFVLTPVVMFATTSLSMQLGWVPFTTVDVSWATPVFISGYVATGSVAGIVLQAVNLAVATLIYAPFVRLSRYMARLQFNSAYKDLQSLVVGGYSHAQRGLIHRVDAVGAVARQLAGRLDTAMARGELYLNYQPVVDVNTHQMHGVEALLRWQHPEHGGVNPMVTIVLAEETGRVEKLGLWILERAVKQRAAWTREGLPDFHVAVNVSTNQLTVPGFHAQVAETLRRHGVPPSQLQIEITETAALVENAATHENLSRMAQAGIGIAMDDFGVGHSSLLYLRTEPITTLKIDGSLSRDVLTNPANLDIIATIHDLCRLMGVATVIEYVDNEKQLEKLMGIGTFLIQGHFFSPPLPGEGIGGFMAGMEKIGGSDQRAYPKFR